MEKSQLLTRKEAALYLGLRPGTLEVWASKKTPVLPYIKVGRLVKYRLKDIEDFLKERTITS